ncbi:MAG TPA: tRNA uridine-5-carboxymethylaminomethyl(34) synthesis enzyme MnmG, partial [Tepidisphaeraceae bacterium]|nr:tRNA uridine-5-carboxymethylaminomethyl(34) synthesis enzyme MnmG [Tepidisphaeraceae bacterium]
GPAVWGPRAQADKYKYAIEVQRLLSTCENLDIIRGEVAEIETDDKVTRWQGDKVKDSPSHLVTPSPCHLVTGIQLSDGTHLRCRAVIVTTGTFLRALMHTGERKTEGGRVNESAAKGLSACLTKLGLELGRLKTGTPPRLKRQSIDFSQFEIQEGDPNPAPFSYLNEYPQNAHGAAVGPTWKPPLPQVNCYLGATNQSIHDIIRANLHRAPMYSGQIQSTGPRYCPSIEDKVVRFADKPSHQIFLEPEGLDTDEIYCNGISTSLPADVQEKMIHLIPGLENAEILRWGYAVEYDMVWPTQIRSTLETKSIAGLFLAGQINGTSGYEEAAAQGLMAGINAAQFSACGLANFTLRRDQAYIGVLIDDLVTKPPTEPYRMFTSRAEHRLHLRADNADERLTSIGRDIGLVDDDRFKKFTARRDAVVAGIAMLRTSHVNGIPADEFLRRPETDWNTLRQHLPVPTGRDLAQDVARLIEIRIKYEGYITRQDQQIERFAKLETKLIPITMNYATVTGLRNEARQKLIKFTPRSLGQALRISGITPADVTLLAVHLSRASH